VTMFTAWRWQAAVLAFGLLAGCASVQSVPPAARSELAPTGKLRVGLILSNQVLVTKDPQTGELRGVTVTLGKALAKRPRCRVLAPVHGRR
jgi:polar amino acid transport system substrate-binding protein